MAVVWTLCLSGWTLVSQMPDQFRSEVKVKIDSAAVVAPVLAERKIEVDEQTRAGLVSELLLSDTGIQKIAEMTGATAKPGESQEALLEGLRAALGLEGGENDEYVLSATQNDPQSALQLLKVAIGALSETAKATVEAEATSEIQALEQKIHDVNTQMRETESSRSPSPMASGAGARAGGAQEGVEQRYLSLKAELEALSKRRDEVRASRDHESQAHPEIFRVISTPEEPGVPSAPNRIALHSVVLFSALLIAAVLAMAVNLLRPTLNSPQRLRDVTGLPVLACIEVSENPHFKRGRKRSRLAFLGVLTSLAVFFLGLILLERNGLNLHHLSI